MKHRYLWVLLLLAGNLLLVPYLFANEPESAYLFAYGTDKNANKNGLHFAWSIDQREWHPIGPEASYVKSDYGTWGAQKRMLSPFLFQGANGVWHCVWGLNEKDGVFAHASSPDLIYWGRQSYPEMLKSGNCLEPEISYEASTGKYTIRWVSESSGSRQVYASATSDFKTYSEACKAVTTEPIRREVLLSGKKEKGTVHRVSWEVIETLLKADQLMKYKDIQNGERLRMDPALFKDPVKATFTLEPDNSKKISDMLMGIFFEDINYAADGGIYAELVQNRGFEYSPEDRGREPDWDSKKAWSVTGEGNSFEIDTVSPIHPNNKHYAVLQINNKGGGLINEGFGGMPVKAGEKYDFSLFARTSEARKGKVAVRLIGKNGEVYGEAHTRVISDDWKKYEAVVTAKASADDARIEVIPQMTGRVDLDMISLFPQKTFKNRKNGLRSDLAEVIADLQPRFVRFPGGCVAHGNGLCNIYRWENTIGPLEARKPQPNLWGYHQTAGLGYYEYFQFCEDIGAEPLPVVAAGVPCQNSSVGGAGQQGGIPMCEMHDYVKDVLNLIEWANGDPKKSEWAKKRAEAGHPKPFNLKYLGVGNEDLITDIFEERFKMIFEAVKEKYPEIVVIGTVGPFNEGTDYVEGWNLAAQLEIPMVDEHYYQTPGWFLNNQDYYDKYDRSKSKVYLGEYAVHVPGRKINVETALLEALHLIGCERNGDIVSMTSYAPLLAKEGYTRWNPDLIYFNNTEVKPTVSYYTQLLFGQNSGDEYISSQITLSDDRFLARKRVAMSVLKENDTNDLILKVVNLLPVSVESEIDLSGMGIEGRTATVTVLHGEPEDEKVRPQTGQMEVANCLITELPAYSLTVIRLAGE